MLGITSPLLAVPSVSLGAFEVTVLEAARAYAALAAAGTLPVLRSYTAVVHADGRVLEELPGEGTSVFDPAEVYLVTSALEGVVDRGTGAALRSLGSRRIGADGTAPTSATPVSSSTPGPRDRGWVGSTTARAFA